MDRQTDRRESVAQGSVQPRVEGAHNEEENEKEKEKQLKRSVGQQ